MPQFDFTALREGKTTYADMVAEVSYKDLQNYIELAFETVETILKDATDAAVNFVPNDPKATEDGERGWTISHIVAHLTAGFEENASVSSILARGLALEARLHAEAPWETLKTAEQVRARLNESRRMSLAYLSAWPDQPNLTTTITRIPAFGPMNAIGVGMLGFFHAQMHYEQLRETLNQAAESANA
ncbi:hypothetical protein KSD_85720 [Ktedonobacter sp. SOSP1-85]|uniref:DinB family protein n=1 Tax=Ktedonobacter sp. SOSP1-85 TaxID=2778367 RepID=UPI001915F87F|nr:DinB family protein [Ktedonobacter sp. SOSP1-85]GHO80801.1 hypothetical protein KSD_85720 [Ktedonobacter sp. SOSP1-85]